VKRRTPKYWGHPDDWADEDWESFAKRGRWKFYALAITVVALAGLVWWSRGPTEPPRHQEPISVVYFDNLASYGSDVAQIRWHEQELGRETNGDELSRLRQELSELKNSCQQVTRQYNSDAANDTRALDEVGLPRLLDASVC
jgi:hypothetical protein